MPFQDWISVANNVAANEKTYVIRDLIPATRYTVRVTAHNHAGSSVATYDVTTLTPDGGLSGERNYNSCTLLCCFLIKEHSLLGDTEKHVYRIVLVK